MTEKTMAGATMAGATMAGTAAPEAAGDGDARQAAAAAAELAAAWAADPEACASVLRYRAAKARSEEPAPDSCAVLDGLSVSYQAYGRLQRCDPATVERFERAEAQYQEALSALSGLEATS